MPHQIIHFIAAFSATELFALVIFNFIRKKLAGKGTNSRSAIVKGLIERFM